MSEGWPMMLRELFPGCWLYRTELGNYGIKDGSGHSTFGSMDDAMAYAHRMSLRQAAHLLEDALAVLKDRWRTSHLPDCPRRRDDYDCTCGLSDLCGRIEDWCKEVRFE